MIKVVLPYCKAYVASEAKQINTKHEMLEEVTDYMDINSENLKD